ncbi:LAME_0H10902g1_1 [Lachancea meyersii CBS 8951]|uniref:LAME_0H10902g1_1 n=1 Tax=Lachancea meyersii CBS 8951 TaxID=1266667 RepID=A0A1G4KGD3_9SACH|nr:LAME_0H10902g1_1 [Lachancea meyersii CBS 8951]
MSESRPSSQDRPSISQQTVQTGSDNVSSGGSRGSERVERALERLSRDEEPPRGTVVYEDDISEILVGIKRLIVGHDSLNSQVQQMDSKTAQTQLDLKSLVTRSANNNRHLQDLLVSNQEGRSRGRAVGELSQSTIPDQAESDEINRLRQELELYKQQHAHLTAINAQIAQKQHELADVQTQCALVVAKLAEMQREFEKLQRDHKELDAQIDRTLLEKCKAVENNLAVSAASFLPSKIPTSSVPMTKMNQITSMLRKNQTNGRRVVSLNAADSMLSYAPSNNSEDNLDED